MITGAQIRAARAVVRWSQGGLAISSKLPIETIRRAENADGEAPLTMSHENAIRVAFEAAGVVFTNGDEPGVKLTRALYPAARKPRLVTVRRVR